MSLRATEDVAWQALERMPDGVAVFAPDWTILYINPAGAAVLDRTVAELTGADMWRTFPEAVGTEFHSRLLAAAEPGAGPQRWSAHYGPVHGWFSDEAWRVGDQVVVVYVRSDEPRAAESTRQRLTGEVRTALARSQLLLTASEALQRTTTLTEVGEAVAALLSDDERPPALVDLAVLEPDGEHLRGVRPHVLPDDIRERYRRVPLDADQPAAECMRTGRTIWVPDPSAIADRYPDLREHWLAPDRQAVACAPLPGPTGPQGVLVFVWARPRPADVGDEALLATLAVYAGQAVTRLRVQEERLAAERTRYEDTRAAMLAMQRTLLAGLPVLPGVRIEAHYVPAEEDTAAGGDWFDAIPLAGGRVALVVGDVVGHGAVAAATMGQLRAVTGHLLAEGADLPTASAAVDRFAGRVRGARGASVCLAVLDPATGDLAWVTHGHPPPLLVDAAGARFLTGAPAGPEDGAGAADPDGAGSDGAGSASGGLLGIGAGPGSVRTAQVPVGATLLLYTDGLVESRSRGLAAGLAELRRVALGPGAAHDAAALGARVLAGLGPDGFDDDVTVLAVQRTAAVRALSVAVGGELAALRSARRALGAWLEPLDLDPDDVDNLLMAVSEALSNALEHAYPAGGSGPPAAVTLGAALGTDGVLRVDVGDRGRWRRPAADPGSRGRGLQMMRLLVDTVVIDDDRPGGGTRVLLSRRPARRAVFGTAAPVPPRHRPSDLVLDVERGERPVVRARGVVDMVSAPALRQKLLDVGRGGVVPVLLDLDGLDQLASAGVAVLHELRGQCALRLQVRDGSPVGRVLALTGLDDLVARAPAPPTDDALLAPPA